MLPTGSYNPARLLAWSLVVALEAVVAFLFFLEAALEVALEVVAVEAALEVMKPPWAGQAVTPMASQRVAVWVGLKAMEAATPMVSQVGKAMEAATVEYLLV